MRRRLLVAAIMFAALAPGIGHALPPQLIGLDVQPRVTVTCPRGTAGEMITCEVTGDLVVHAYPYTSVPTPGYSSAQAQVTQCEDNVGCSGSGAQSECEWLVAVPGGCTYDLQLSPVEHIVTLATDGSCTHVLALMTYAATADTGVRGSVTYDEVGVNGGTGGGQTVCPSAG